MDKLTDAQLDALFKVQNADSLLAALRAIYEQGCDWGQANPLVTVIDVPAASSSTVSTSTTV